MRRKRRERKADPAAGVDGGSDGAVAQVDEAADIVDVGGGTAGKHGATPRESEALPLQPHPILILLLHDELLVRHIGVPHPLPTLRPPHGHSVARRRRNPTAQDLRAPPGSAARDR